VFERIHECGAQPEAKNGQSAPTRPNLRRSTGRDSISAEVKAAREVSPNKSQTTFITVIKNVMSWKEDFSRACNGEFLGVHDGFPAIAVRRSSFPL
jgi:hypothetical protein